MSINEALFDTVEVQVDGQSCESWASILDQFNDSTIYQTWAYGSIRWGERNLSHLVLRRDSHILAAAQLRIARLPLLPAGVAYLRWGPVYHRKEHPDDPAVIHQMLACLRNEYSIRRRLALQVICNAYVGDPRGAAYLEALALEGLRPDTSGPRYQTIVVDLTAGIDVMRKRLDRKWRNHLNQSEKNGLVIDVNDGQDAYRDFVRIYKTMWERKRFETSVDVDEFGRIQQLLVSPARMQTFLALKDGEPIAAVVCSHMGDAAIYLLGATSERARELKAAYYLQWQVMVWLKERGAALYDLGGVNPVANPGSYSFKAGFGGAEKTQLRLHTCPGGFLSAGVAAFCAWRRRQSSHRAVQ
jgi:hypothetical protein